MWVYTPEEVYQAGYDEYLKGLPCIPSYWQTASFHKADEVFIAGYKSAKGKYENSSSNSFNVGTTSSTVS